MSDSETASPVDLDGLTVEQLISLRASLEAMIARKQDQAKAALLADIKQRAAKIGVSAEALAEALSAKSRTPAPSDAHKKRGRPRKEEAAAE